MKAVSSKRVSGSYSEKRPRRLKWAGFPALVIAFVGLADGVESQQPKKVPRIGYLYAC